MLNIQSALTAWDYFSFPEFRYSFIPWEYWYSSTERQGSPLPGVWSQPSVPRWWPLLLSLPILLSKTGQLLCCFYGILAFSTLCKLSCCNAVMQMTSLSLFSFPASKFWALCWRRFFLIPGVWSYIMYVVTNICLMTELNDWIKGKEMLLKEHLQVWIIYINFWPLGWVFMFWNGIKERGGKYTLIFWGEKEIHWRNAFQIIFLAKYKGCDV